MSTNSPQTPAFKRAKPFFQKTPNNDRGSSPHASSDGYATLKRDHLTLWIANDIGRHQTCNVDVMLKHFLSRVVTGNKVDVDQLFDDCLRAVLPLCPKYKDKLATYYEADREVPGYAPFVSFANDALKDLKYIQDEAPLPLTRESSLEIIFCRNAERHLKTPYDNDLLTDIVPDVFISSLFSARRVQSMLEATWIEIIGQVEDQPPAEYGGFIWQDALSTLEFKKLRGFEYTYYPFDSIDLKNDIDPIKDVMSEAVVSVTKPTVPTLQSHSSAKKSGLKPLQPATRKSSRPATEKSSAQSQAKHAVVPSIATTSRALSTVTPSGASAETASSGIPSGTANMLLTGRIVQDPPPLVQCAIYAAEMLARSTAISHAINLMIFDQVVWIWWYDHEGAIQSNGIDLVTDLPRFLVLLIAFQRFTLQDWGFIQTLNPLADRIHCGFAATEENPFLVDYGDNIKVQVAPDTPLYKRHSLVGRASRVLPAKSRSIVGTQSLADIPLVAKFSWVDASRISEDVIIQRALERGKDNKAMTEHMPRIFACRTFGHSTATIREALGIPRRTRRVLHDGKNVDVQVDGFRVLRSIVSEELKPIEKLQGEEFMDVFFQIERCHYEAWNVGIHHNDPSLANFMYRVVGDHKLGVPNDWDLATDERDEKDMHNGLERTGTVPYMALDLLRPNAWSGNIQHLYRHDLEAIIWILAWAILCYDDGERKIPFNLRGWLTGDHSIVSEKKSWFLMHLDQVQPPPSRAQEWVLAEALLAQLAAVRLNRMMKMKKGITEKTTKEVAYSHWEVIEDSELEDALKEVILGYKPQFQ